MKIAIIGHAHYPIKEPFVGGLETHTALLANQLVTDGHEVTLYSKHGSKTKARNKAIFYGDAKDGDNPILNFSYSFAIADIAAKGFDLIINNSLSHIPLLLHTAYMPHMITIFHTPPLHKMVKALKKYQNDNRTFVAVSNITSKQWLTEANIDANVVSNGIDLNLWKANSKVSAKQSAIWFGRITPEKGTHVAVESCKKLGLPLKIVGNIYNKTYFKDKIEPYLDDQIEYVGHKNQDELQKLIAQSTVCLVTPLWSEPFGFVVVEAMACGTPVAGLPNGALPSLIHSKVGSVSKNNTIDAFSESVSLALSKDRLDCIKYIHENFSSKAMVDSYLELHSDYVTASSNAWQTMP